MTAPESPTYFRPTNADTGAPTLLTYFTSVLCQLADAHLYDPDQRIDDLAADVRDYLDKLDIPIRPTIKPGRIRIMQEDEPDENMSYGVPEVYATVMVFFTDAEPDDPRLQPLLAEGFHAGRLNAHVEFEIPTTESEAALEAAIAADDARGAEFVAHATAERSQAAEKEAKATADPFGKSDLEDLFD